MREFNVLAVALRERERQLSNYLVPRLVEQVREADAGLAAGGGGRARHAVGHDGAATLREPHPPAIRQ